MKATRSGNAQIHGMTTVSPASIAYIATQVSVAVSNWKTTHRSSTGSFALSSSAVFSRTDTVTNSNCFYNSILELFDDIEEQEEVQELMEWWNR